MDYVVGFAFCGDHVALIEKTRPAWQAGKLNGIGGKIEGDESIRHAMVREFFEETSVLTVKEAWARIADLRGTDYSVFVLATHLVEADFNQLLTTTDETVLRFHRNSIPWDLAVPNLRWLIPLCRCEGNIQFPITVPYGPDEAKK